MVHTYQPEAERARERNNALGREAQQRTELDSLEQAAFAQVDLQEDILDRAEDDCRRGGHQSAEGADATRGVEGCDVHLICCVSVAQV